MGRIFEIVAAVTKTSINFIWPGMFYLIAEKITGTKKSLFDHITSWILIVLGVLIFLLVFFTTILLW